MNTDTVDDLAKLKAIAGERQQRDSGNNPQIPDDKVPKGSAAAKTSSALSDYAKGLQAEEQTMPSTRSYETNAIPSSLQGQPTLLSKEPELINSIASQAQDATTDEGAEKMQAAAQKLEQAYQQDEEWLSKHPEHGERRL